tara:strand:- start:1288 stop:2892 length:1605 start_codon:yes stop_codon:yes gene_type:complete
MAVNNKKRQVQEIIKCGKEPLYFINKYVKIQHPERGTIGFDTYQFQDECVKDFIDNRFNVIVKSRQLGLSTLVAAYAVWLAIFYKDKNILVIATKLAVAQNFIKKVKVAIRSLPQWLVIPEITGNNKQSVEFGNGSTIKAIPTSDDAGRSEALSLLIIDEAAFVRNFDELWMGLYPTLSTGGRAIVLSTPNGVGGQYYDLYMKAESGENDFNPIKLQWNVHPERDDSWFESEAKNMNQKQIAQELMCDFAAAGDTFLSAEQIEYVRNSTKSPIERWGPENAVWVWKYPLTEKKYLISADVARGDGADYSAFVVFDVESSEVVADFKAKIPPDNFATVLAEAGRRYNEATIAPESNTYGYAVLMKLKELNYPAIYFAKEKDRFAAMYGDGNIGKAGFSTQGGSRAKILTKLEEVIRNKHLIIYSSRIYEELKTFIWKGTKPQAMRGKNDDLVMSLAIGCWLFDASPKYSKQSADLNSAMLQAMGVNKVKKDSMIDPRIKDMQKLNPFKPVVLSGEQPSEENNDDNPLNDFLWLLK